MAELILKPKEDLRIRAGHLWVFSNEVAEARECEDNGGLVDIRSAPGRVVGRGYYNRHTLIAARLLSPQCEAIDTDFFIRRIRAAADLRQAVYGESQAGRVVYSEGDLLPGLIADRYQETLVVQLLTLGMEKMRETVLAALDEVYRPQGILLRNDSPFREMEGLPRETSVAAGDVPERVEIREEGARFAVDLHAGQKTGFFFDQRDTRALVRQIALARRVLDCFCYTGGFAINAALGGATSVLAVDESLPALETLAENARLNNVADRIAVQQANCFALLRELAERGERFSLVILDPPAFVKSKSHLKAGLAGYREINLTAMKLLAPGGLLVTCSCSQNLTTDSFYSMLGQASRSAGRRFRIRASGTQAADHPILQAMPETQYLKCCVLEAIDM